MQLQDSKAINNIAPAPSKPSSTFSPSRQVGITPVFGKYTPFFALEVVPDDGPIDIEPSCSTRSYTLKAPLFGNVKKHVAFFQVPLQSLLPFNWEKIVKNPSHGSDVQGVSAGTNIIPALNGVNCVVSNFSKRLYTQFSTDFAVLKTNLSAITSQPDIEYLKNIMLFVVRWEMFFSRGSLLSLLGVNFSHLIKISFTPSSGSLATRFYSFDKFCQLLLTSINNWRFSIIDNNGTSSTGYGSGASHVRRCLDFMRSNGGPFVFSFEQLSGSPSVVDISNYELVSVVSPTESEPFNFGRFLSYQIVCAHYFTNDRIDYINTSDLYRQYISYLIKKRYDRLGNSLPTFVYNGISCFYDYLSGFFLDYFLTSYSTVNYTNAYIWSELYPYLNAIFGFNYSLRFLDYFTGSRPRNLAISGPNTPTNVQVNNNSVDVINITRSLVAQRFLNAVARIPSNIEDYSEKILGRKPSYDWHNPKYLFSFEYDIYSSEVENTGNAQISDPSSVTSVMRGSAGNLRFTIDIDRHSFIIGIESFDIRRFYYTTQDKNTMAIDRFDMFVPELQYIGDQELKLSELIGGTEKDVPFGYQFRDMQFKQSFDICAGGFVEDLPGWLFKFDIDKFTPRALSQNFISPSFIRCVPEELDEFYVSLTGLTLASYFHFIEVWNVKVTAKRPMIAAPQIL